MDSDNLADTFRAEAEKIVSMREWREQTRSAYANFQESILANIVDKTVSIPLSILAGSTMKGFFTDHNGETYISEKTAQKLTSLTTRFSPLALSRSGRDYLGELNRKSEQAFSQCEDHSKKVATKQLKPAR